MLGKQGAWWSFEHRCQGGHRRSAPVPLFAEPTARASCVQYRTPSQFWFAMPRPGPAPQLVDCGEIGPVASHRGWKHQMLNLEEIERGQERWLAGPFPVPVRGSLGEG